MKESKEVKTILVMDGIVKVSCESAPVKPIVGEGRLSTYEQALDKFKREAVVCADQEYILQFLANDWSVGISEDKAPWLPSDVLRAEGIYNVEGKGLVYTVDNEHDLVEAYGLKTRTWTKRDWGYGCAECCNGDRCDEDCTAKHKRGNCPHCKNGWIPETDAKFIGKVAIVSASKESATKKEHELIEVVRLETGQPFKVEDKFFIAAKQNSDGQILIFETNDPNYARGGTK